MGNCPKKLSCLRIVLKTPEVRATGSNIRRFPLIALILIVSLYVNFSFPAALSATSPASTNYRLEDWVVGGGGTERGQSANFKTETVADPTVAEPGRSANYQVNPGLLFTQMANVPPAPAVTNPSDYYDRLHLVIAIGNNPGDTKYAVAISTDNFMTTNYVKADNTVGATLVAADWRTYASWGGAAGINILGLQASTTYQVKVKAVQGDFTESPWGPFASQLTSPPGFTFDIDVAPTDQETDAPYIVNLGQMSVGSVTTATDRIWIDFDTNANNGGVVYVGGLNGGLESTAANYTIAAVSANLDSTQEGFGIRNASLTQTAGGPFTADNPFGGGGNIVGSTGTTLVPLNTSLAPIVGGRSSQDVKAVISNVTPGATDYTETLTIVAAGTF